MLRRLRMARRYGRLITSADQSKARFIRALGDSGQVMRSGVLSRGGFRRMQPCRLPLRSEFPAARRLSLHWSSSPSPPRALLAQEPPHGQDKPPGPALSPAEAIAKMTVPPGFTVELVASEPDIVNPVAMTFDERGPRLGHREPRVPAARAGPGPRPRQGARGHRRRRQGRQVHGLRRGAEHPLAASPSATAASGSPTRPTSSSSRTPTATARPTRRRSSSPASAATTPTSCPTRSPGAPTAGSTAGTASSTPATSSTGGKTYDFTCAIFRIHPRTRDFELFCEGTSNPWGIAYNRRGRLAFASACVIDHLWHLTETRLLPPPGRAVSPVHLEDRVDRRAPAPEGRLLRHPLSSTATPIPRSTAASSTWATSTATASTSTRSSATARPTSGQAEPDFLSANDAWFMPVVAEDRPRRLPLHPRLVRPLPLLPGRQPRPRRGSTASRAGSTASATRTRRGAKPFDLARATNDELIERLRSPNVFAGDGPADPEREVRPVARATLQKMALDPGRPATPHARPVAAGQPQGAGRGFHQQVLGSADAPTRNWGVRAVGAARRGVAARVREVQVTGERPVAGRAGAGRRRRRAADQARPAPGAAGDDDPGGQRQRPVDPQHPLQQPQALRARARRDILAFIDANPVAQTAFPTRPPAGSATR